MDPKYGSGTSNHSRTDAVVTEDETEASSPPIFLLDSKHESESRRSSDTILSRSASRSSKSSELSRSMFSSSSSSSADDFILVDPIMSNSISLDVSFSKSPQDAKPLCQDDCNELNGMPCKYEMNASTSSTAQVSDFTDESLSPTTSIKKSPSIQVMERQGGYDPNRVPSSIFVSKPSTPMEWSAASDDSLFSINVSLSRDHFPLMGGDVRASGELHRSGELNKCKELDKSEEISCRHSPAVKEREQTEKSSDTERDVIAGNSLIEARSHHEPIKKELHFEEEIQSGGNRDYSTSVGHSEGNGVFRDSYKAIHHSNGNGTSLAFPVSRTSTGSFGRIVYYKRKKTTRGLCFHSPCSCGSCCSMWPSCCCKFSGCFSCKWSGWLCCSRQWLSCSGCCHKWSCGHRCCCK